MPQPHHAIFVCTTVTEAHFLPKQYGSNSIGLLLVHPLRQLFLSQKIDKNVDKTLYRRDLFILDRGKKLNKQ